MALAVPREDPVRIVFEIEDFEGGIPSSLLASVINYGEYNGGVQAIFVDVFSVRMRRESEIFHPPRFPSGVFCSFPHWSSLLFVPSQSFVEKSDETAICEDDTICLT